MNSSPLSLVVERIQSQGMIGTQSDEQLQAHGDFYGSALHFVAAADRNTRRVMPPHPKVPQPGFEQVGRWSWLRLFGRGASATLSAVPDFMVLDQYFEGGVEPARHKVACAIEFLAGMREERAARQRLVDVARPQKQREVGSKPDKRFIYGVWSGLYLLMEQCMQIAGADWSQIESASFPQVITPDGASDPIGLTLTSWPEGYASWLQKLEKIDERATFNIHVPASLDFVWSRALRLASFERRQIGERPREDKSWVGHVMEWEAEASTQGSCYVLSTRPADVSFGRRWRQIGRDADHPLELRHACPLALLLAAMAAEHHLLHNSTAIYKLGTSMADSHLKSVGTPAPDYQVVWNRAAARLSKILRGEMPPTAAPRPASREATRFAGAVAGTGTFVQRPLILGSPTLDAEDAGIVLARLPLAALGQQVSRHLKDWEHSGIPCFGQVYQPLTDELEAPFPVLVGDDWVEASRTLMLSLEPRPGAHSVLQRFWRGEIARDDVEVRTYIVDGGAEDEPWPVLFLQFIVMSL